ncbi:hypothetical protein ACFQMM_01900 [Saliphagus sp. GCM10025308]
MTDRATGTSRWGTLEQWSPTLFIVGFALELVFAVNHGLAYLVEAISFIDWLYPTVLLGRLAVLLGLAGLSVRVVNTNPRFGKLSRGVVSVAALFTVGLLALSVLDIVGVTTSIIAVFGIGTVILTILTFLLFGVAGLRTDAYPAVVGALLLVATLAVIGVLVSQGVFSTNVRGAVGEGVNAIAFLAIWRFLNAELKETKRAEPAPTEARYG